MEWNPLRSVLNQALRSNLEKYVSNIDFDSLGVGGGAMVLKDLELRRESFPSKRGFHLARGFVKELRVSIPWTQLLSAPVLVEILTCEIVFIQDEEYNDDEEGDAVRTEVEKKDVAAAAEGGWMSDMIKTIAANATLQVSNLVFKIERKQTLVAAVSLKSFAVCTCDANTWEKRFQKPGEVLGELFKLVEIGGLTVNVERRRIGENANSPRKSGATTTSSFEFPVLNRTDAKVRICLHLNPSSSSSIVPVATTTATTIVQASSISNLFQRVSTVVVTATNNAPISPVSSPGLPQAESTSNGAAAEDVMQRKLSSAMDPFHSALTDPFHHAKAAFVAGVDVWIERFDFSVSEQQLEILLEFIQPPTKIVREPSRAAMPEPPPPAPTAAPPPPPPPLPSSTGWTSWAWQTVAPVYDENGTKSGDQSTIATAKPPKKPQPTLSIVGLRIDRCTLSLMLHPKHSAEEITPTKKPAVVVVAVQTPTGIVFVEDDEEDEETKKRKAQVQKQRKLVTFCEVVLRTITLQANKAGSELPLELFLDVDSIEATRWHDDYVNHHQLQPGESSRHEVFFSWFGKEQQHGGSRNISGGGVCVRHPHASWNLWAHPSALGSPAIRLAVAVSTQEILLDLSLAPLSITVDQLLLRGARYFVPKEGFKLKKRAASPPAPRNELQPVVEVLLTCPSAQVAIAHENSSLRMELGKFCFAQRGGRQVDAKVDSCDLIIKSSSASKRVASMNALEVEHMQDCSEISLSRISCGLSPTQANVLREILVGCIETLGKQTSPWKQACSIQFDSTVSDHVILELVLGQIQVKTNPVAANGKRVVRVSLSQASLCAIAGQTQQIFASQSVAAENNTNLFVDFVGVLAKPSNDDGDDGEQRSAIQMKLSTWTMDWSGVIKAAQWVSHFFIQLPASRNNSSSTTRKSPVLPRLSLDFEPGRLVLLSSSLVQTPAEAMMSEIRFPMIAVRMNSNDEYVWTMDGWRVIINNHAVLANAKFGGLIGMHFRRNVSVHLFPFLLDFSQDHLECIHYNVQALLLVMPSRAAAAKPPVTIAEHVQLDFNLSIDDVNVVMRVRDEADERSIGLDPISDVPNMLSLRLRALSIAYKSSLDDTELTVELQDLLLSEEDWPIFAFRNNSNNNALTNRITWLRKSDGNNFVSATVLSFDCNLRGGALRAPLAVFASFMPKSQASIPATTPAKPRKFRLQLTLEPCTVSIPISSTLAPAQGLVDCVFIKLPNGLHWNTSRSNNRALGGALEFGWCTLSANNNTPVLNTFVSSKLWCQVDPVVQIQLPQDTIHIHLPALLIALQSKQDIVRLQTCALVLLSRSALESALPLSSAVAPPSPPHATTYQRAPLPVTFSMSEFLFTVQENDLLAVRVENVACTSQAEIKFALLTIHSLQQRCIVSSHDFYFGGQICELSRDGAIDIVVEPSILDALFVAFCEPITRLNLSMLPRRTRSKQFTPSPLQPRTVQDSTGHSFKVLLPMVRISVHSKPMQAAVVEFKVSQGIASMLSSSTVDLTLAGFELLLLPSGSSSSVKKFVPKTDIRLFGELTNKQFSLDLTDVRLNLGLENVAIALTVLEQFDLLRRDRFVPFARHFKVPVPTNVLSPPQPQQHTSLGAEEIALSSSFDMLLGDAKLEIDPLPGQLVFSNREDLPGFKLRFQQGERRVSSLNISGCVMLERALERFAGLDFECEFLMYDSLRETWTRLLEFTMSSDCMPADSGEEDENGNDEDDALADGDFSSAFASWMEDEIADNTRFRTHRDSAFIHPQTFKTLGEAGELYWIRWKPPALEADMSSLERVAISNAISQTLTLSCYHVPLPLLDIKITTTNMAVHVLHHCSTGGGGGGITPLTAASELFVVCVPQSKLRLVIKSKRDWLVLMDHVFRLEVNRVADFTRNTVLRDFPIKAEISPSLLDLFVGNVEVDLRPESLQVLSHAVRGLAFDFSPLQLKKRVAEYNTAAAVEDGSEVIVSQNSCACTRVSFVNLTGSTLWFKRDEEPSAVCLTPGSTLAYSWTSCICPAPKLQPRRIVKFSFDYQPDIDSNSSSEDDDVQEATWSKAVDLETMGMFHLDVALSSSEKSDLWVSVQLGEPTIQTVVALYSSDCAVNKCSTGIEMLPISGNTFAVQQQYSVIPLFPNQVTRFMLDRNKRNGWMFRASGCKIWSKPIVLLSPGNKPVLVEIPTADSRTLFVWVTFARQRADDDDEANNNTQWWWNTVELTPTYVFENHTQFDLTVRVRPEHRWEALQYALQSVALTTTPPGPAGTWLALNPASTVSPHAPSPPLSHADNGGEDETAQQQQPKQGAVLAQELLKSVSSPRQQQQQQPFSSSLELSSALADVSSTEFVVHPDACIALTLDPRESHALLVTTAAANNAATPLRLHANMLNTTQSWQRSVDLCVDVTAIAVAQGMGSTNVLISVSPLFLLRNDTDRTLFWVAVSLVDQQKWVSSPQPISPGEEIPVHSRNCDALMLACLCSSMDTESCETLEWSDPFGLAKGAINVSVPMTPTLQARMNGEEDLVLQVCAITDNDRVCTISSRIKLVNHTSHDMRWRTFAGSEDFHLAPNASMSVPSQLLPDGGLCAVIQLFPSSTTNTHHLFLDPLTEQGATAMFLLGGKLMCCTALANGMFTVREDVQPRFILENRSCTHAVELVSCTAKVGGQCGSKFILPTQTTVPFDWQCFDNLQAFGINIDGTDVIGQHLKRQANTTAASNMDRFFAQDTDEKLRLRMIPSAPSLEEQENEGVKLGLWHPSEERGWSPTVSTASGTVYTFHMGNILVSAPLENGAKMLTVSSANQAVAAIETTPDAASVEEPNKKLRIVLFRLDSLLVKFSTRQTDVLLFGLTELCTSVEQSASKCEVDIMISHLQLESLLPQSEYPIVAAFSTTTIDVAEDNNSGLRIRTVFSTDAPLFFKQINVELAPFVLNVEDDTLKRWILVFAPLFASMQADWRLLGDKSTTTTHNNNLVFVCETLEVSALQCLLTLKTSQRVFVGIDRTPINLWPVSAYNVRCSFQHLRNELAANYLADLLLSSPALLGSLEIIGNPTGFIRSVASGVHDLVAIPFRELKRGWGPRKVLRSVALGWLGLLSHVADGTLTSVSGFSASLARNLSMSIQRNNDEGSEQVSRARKWLTSIAGLVVRPAENAAFLVSRTTKRITTRLRPAVVRLRPMSSGLSQQVDVERMLAWKLFSGENVAVMRTDLCDFDVDDDEARKSLQIRVILSSKGVCALQACCLLHGNAATAAASEWLFFYSWKEIVSVQESLARLNLAVLFARREDGQQQDKLLRFTFLDETQRRAFVLDALSCMEDYKE